ncbi:MAG: thioesterase family protein [Gammaproteobacteria bacterium]|nr:thioesterase family protein [Gammaproteobacteria bacterium]
MDNFSMQFEVRWADVDANRHMRHSAYNDYAAHLRVKLLKAIDMDLVTMAKHNFGPVLFREETIFYRELNMGDVITVDARLQKTRPDGSRWTFVHSFTKPDGKLAATVTVDGAWMDLAKRKLTALPEQFLEKVFTIPQTEDFLCEE